MPYLILAHPLSAYSATLPQALQLRVLVQVISDTSPLLGILLVAFRAVIASPSPSVILSEAKNLNIRLRINSAKQSHLLSPSPETASVALSDLAMTSKAKPTIHMSPIYLNEITERYAPAPPPGPVVDLN